MKKKFKCEVDCANCAAKMEAAIKLIPGIKDASVNFLTQKMTIETVEENLDELMPAVVAACKKVEPDCEIFI